MSTIIENHRAEIDQMMVDLGLPALGTPGGHIEAVFVTTAELEDLAVQNQRDGKVRHVVLTLEEQEQVRRNWVFETGMALADPHGKGPSDERTIAIVRPYDTVVARGDHDHQADP